MLRQGEKMSHIQKILEKNNYIVSIEKINDGFLLLFPNRLFFPATSFSAFFCKYEKDSLFYSAYGRDGRIIEDFTVKCPKYAQRMSFLYHIFLSCDSIKYDVSLIKIKDSKKDLFSYIRNNELSIDEKESEKDILAMFGVDMNNIPNSQIGNTCEILKDVIESDFIL